MTREQQLEQELAELRKAKNTLIDRLDDAGKRSDKDKAAAFDNILVIAKACIDKRLTGVENASHDTFNPVARKALEMILGPDYLGLIKAVTQ